MRGNFPACVSFVLLPDNDGQPFHATPGDAGGATAYGVTQVTLSRWLKRPASIEDVKALTPESVQPIYEAYYWKAIFGDGLPSGLDLMIMDHAVVAGVHQAAIELQEEVGADVDGCIGPETIAEVNKYAPAGLIIALHIRQAQHYQTCRGCDLFGAGWLARLERRAAAANALRGKPGLLA